MIVNNNSIRRSAQVAVAAGTLALLGTGIAAACHPQGVIQKDVEDVTTGSKFVAADTTGSALTVHPGDTLVYKITVTNQATADQDQMIKTLITDTLPAGVTLVDKGDLNVGTVWQRQSASVTITAKVTAQNAGYIENQACFTGDSIDHKVPQKGCDVAYVNVAVPTPTPTPSVTPTPTPSTTPTPTPSASPSPSPQVLSDTTQPTLPDTGAGLAGTSLGLGAMVAAGMTYIRSRKQK